MKKIYIPADSPAWQHYLEEGWVEIERHGMWATLAFY